MELDPDAPELSDDELVAGMLEDGEGCEADDSLSALRASDPVPYITDEWVGVSCTVDNVPLDEISEGDGLITQADGITSIALPLDDVNDQIESEVDADAATGDMEGMEALFEQIMSTFEIAMAVEAPGAVIEHNGTRVEGSTVIWEIDVFADEPLTEMTATWDTSVDPDGDVSRSDRRCRSGAGASSLPPTVPPDQRPAVHGQRLTPTARTEASDGFVGVGYLSPCPPTCSPPMGPRADAAS